MAATLLLLALRPAAAPQGSLAASDMQIFQAVLEHTVRPHVVGFSNQMDAQPPYSLLVLNETMAVCTKTTQAGAPPCLDSEPFRRASLPAIPAGLTMAMFDRNATTATFPSAVGPDLVLVPTSGLDAALKEWRDSSVGYLVFSQPGYSADGHAMVWVTYACGRCAHGWLFLLHRDDDLWKVDEARLLVVI